MPCFSERKKNILEYAKTKGIESDELETIVEKIVSETIGYSYEGYYAFGINEEKFRLQKIFPANILFHSFF